MKVLITGVDGYIGTVLAQDVLTNGHEVVGLDTEFYDVEPLYTIEGAKQFPIIRKDTRTVTEADFVGVDAVIHLADLSNDPLGVLNRENTLDINKNGSARVAQMAKKAGVSRFIYSSSCSAYGIATEDMVSETSELNPQTAYAECKVAVEKILMDLADDAFTVILLRNATVYGPSPKMRFDLVVNNLTGLAATTGKIAMTSDGTPWRPLVHINDVSKAFNCALIAPKELVQKQVFNVGNSKGNYQVKQVAEVVAHAYPGCELTFGNSDGDTRSYRVSFDKIANQLPGFISEYTVERGVSELKALFERIHLTSEQFLSRNFTRIKQINYLLETKQLDGHFYWQKP